MDFMKDLLTQVLQRRMELEDRFIAMEFMKVNFKILRNMDGEDLSGILESTMKEYFMRDFSIKVKNMIKMAKL